MERCPVCRGSRQVTCPRCAGRGYDPYPLICRRCNGHRYVTCDRCRGRGYLDPRPPRRRIPRLGSHKGRP